MDKIIDILGANIIWGFIMLIMLNVNSQISEYSFANLNTSITQMDAVELTKIIEFDFQKAGNLISGNKVAIADSNKLKFYFDDNYNGTKDSIIYSIGTTSAVSATANPNDREVFRKLNNTTYTIGTITKLDFEYLDSLGQKLSYSSLLNQSTRNKIKIIRIELLKEGIYANYDKFYPGVDWTREIKPKNL